MIQILAIAVFSVLLQLWLDDVQAPAVRREVERRRLLKLEAERKQATPPQEEEKP